MIIKYKNQKFYFVTKAVPHKQIEHEQNNLFHWIATSSTMYNNVQPESPTTFHYHENDNTNTTIYTKIKTMGSPNTLDEIVH